MKKWMLAICLMFINGICEAADCFDLAGLELQNRPGFTESDIMERIPLPG